MSWVSILDSWGLGDLHVRIDSGKEDIDCGLLSAVDVSSMHVDITIDQNAIDVD